jgi:hypothetical protein
MPFVHIIEGKMKYELEIVDYGEGDAVTVKEDLVAIFQEFELTGTLAIDGVVVFSIGGAAFRKKATIIKKILKNRTPENLKEKFIRANILLDIVYPSGEKDIFGTYTDTDSGIDFHEVIKSVLLGFEFDEPDVIGKPILKSVKNGKIYSLDSGKLLKQFSIKNGKVKFNIGKH